MKRKRDTVKRNITVRNFFSGIADLLIDIVSEIIESI